MPKYFSDFRAYEDTTRSPGDAVEGWRIHYQTEDGRLYSPFMRSPATTDLSPDKSLELDPTGVNHSITEHGYYYWATKEAAEAYMDLLLRRMTAEAAPRGILRLDKVRGIEVARNKHDIREGNIMEDMQIIY